MKKECILKEKLLRTVEVNLRQRRETSQEEETQDLSDYHLVRGRQRRQTKPPAKYTSYECDDRDGEDQSAEFVCCMSEDTRIEPWSY